MSLNLEVVCHRPTITENFSTERGFGTFGEFSPQKRIPQKQEGEAVVRVIGEILPFILAKYGVQGSGANPVESRD